MRIALHRGDIDYERFLINDPDGNRTDIDFDEIYFTVKKSFKNHPFVLQKSLSKGTIIKLGPGEYQFKIEREDTKNMSFGRYVFDVQLSYKNLLNETCIGCFELLPEATYPENEV